MGVNVEAELFLHFTNGSCTWALANLDVAAWDLPAFLVGRIDQEDTAVAVVEQNAGRRGVTKSLNCQPRCNPRARTVSGR